MRLGSFAQSQTKQFLNKNKQMSARPIDHWGVWGGDWAEFQTFSLCIQLETEAGCSCIVFMYGFHSRVPPMHLSVCLLTNVYLRDTSSETNTEKWSGGNFRPSHSASSLKLKLDAAILSLCMGFTAGCHKCICLFVCLLTNVYLQSSWVIVNQVDV